MNPAWCLKTDEEMKKIRDVAVGQFPIVLDRDELEEATAFFKGLADETRLKIISLLWMDDLCMCEIVSALGAASSTISHHLRIMENGRVIDSRREGKFTIYRVNKEKLAPLLPYLHPENK